MPYTQRKVFTFSTYAKAQAKIFERCGETVIDGRKQMNEKHWSMAGKYVARLTLYDDDGSKLTWRVRFL